MSFFSVDSVVDDRYRLLEHLGDGGCGSVYKAVELGLERIVAIKILHANHLVDEDARSRFMREGKILSRLVHPNLPVFYRFGIWRDTWHYIALEFLSGRSMRALMNTSKRLPPKQAFILGGQIARAMQVAHDNDVIHRDLKPDNVMLVEREGVADVVKVVDFGLAKLSNESTTGQNLTRTGELVGSVFYMSPEQCRGLPADRRVDIYALGCTIYEALAGTPPLSADNPIGLMHKHVCESPLLLTQLLGDSTPLMTAIDSVLFKAMAKDPKDRYDSMEAFANDMEKILAERPTEIAAGPVMLVSSPVSSKSYAKQGLSLVIVLAIIVLSTASLFSWKSVPDALPIAATKEPTASEKEQQFIADLGRLEKRLATTPAGERPGVAQLQYSALAKLADLYLSDHEFDKAEKCLKRQLQVAEQMLQPTTNEVRIYSRLGNLYCSKVLSAKNQADKDKYIKETREFFAKTVQKARHIAHPESFCTFLLQYALFLALENNFKSLNDVFTEALSVAKQQEEVLGSRGESFSQFALDLERLAKPSNREEYVILCDIFLDICEHQTSSFNNEFTFAGPTFQGRRASLPVNAAADMFNMAFPEKPKDGMWKVVYEKRKIRLAKFQRLTTSN